MKKKKRKKINRILIEKIREAFCGVEYPGDENIISTPEHIRECGECKMLYDALVGKKWEDTVAEQFNGYLSHAMSFFTAKGWYYYLPAYLIQSINHNMFRSLHFAPKLGFILKKRWEDRISQLNVQQVEVIVEYLSIVLEVDNDSDYTLETNEGILNYWQEWLHGLIYRDYKSNNVDLL